MPRCREGRGVLGKVAPEVDRNGVQPRHHTRDVHLGRHGGELRRLRTPERDGDVKHTSVAVATPASWRG
ncbi:MAG: hypothetical protein QOH17_3939, partial [Pseudonocardiales bacterium]|nr:hypothetical protein [Pseudonocardiales bacterium]